MPRSSRAAPGLLRVVRREAGGYVLSSREGAPDGAPSHEPCATSVFVHGLGVSSLTLEPALARAARWSRALAPDLPGFGRSPAPRRVLSIAELARVVVAYLDACAASRAVLVGNSVGCQIAAEAAALAPRNVAALVLTGPTGDPRDRSVLLDVLRLAADALRERPALIPRAVFDYLRTSPARTFRTLASAKRHHMLECVASLAQPVIVARGSRDPLVRADWAASLARAAPHGEYVTLERSGHALPFSAPERVDALVRDAACAAGLIA
jgi:2-hydroxy-6-oxonona-2,4-dienedioate hydrolase